jgi:ADP-ribose pyrophosphatase YjhB (NUDIX family)
MRSALDSFLADRTSIYRGETRWGDAIHLRVQVFACAEPPPTDLVTSVRGVVFKGGKVVVVDDKVESHVMPGGRMEAGESIAQTLERELLEECGWTMPSPQLFGVIHFHHLAPRPEGYSYPYPDFLHLLFVGEAGVYRRSDIKRSDEIETGSRLTSISRAMKALKTEQQAILAAAMEARAVAPSAWEKAT